MKIKVRITKILGTLAFFSTRKEKSST